MGLVGEAALGRDLAQRLFGRQHESLRPFHSAPDDVFVRGVADTVAEGNVEVKRAETGEGSEILVSDGRYPGSLRCVPTLCEPATVRGLATRRSVKVAGDVLSTPCSMAFARCRQAAALLRSSRRVSFSAVDSSTKADRSRWSETNVASAIHRR